MKRECIVSCLVIVEVDSGSSENTGIIEALAKHEFLCGVGKLTPDNLSVEILESEV